MQLDLFSGIEPVLYTEHYLDYLVAVELHHDKFHDAGLVSTKYMCFSEWLTRSE